MKLFKQLQLLTALLMILAKSYGKRNYEIILDSCSCTVNPNYGTTPGCRVDKSFSPPRAFLVIQMLREQDNLRFSFAVILERKNNEQFTLLNATDKDACKFLEGKVDITLVNIFRDIIMSAGKMPEKCPVSKDYRYEFKGLYPDPEKFPPYLPEANFSVNMVISDRTATIVTIDTHGYAKQKPRKSPWG